MRQALILCLRISNRGAFYREDSMAEKTCHTDTLEDHMTAIILDEHVRSKQTTTSVGVCGDELVALPSDHSNHFPLSIRRSHVA